MSLKSNGFQFADFFVDVNEGTLSKGGKPLPLPPRAFKLLSVLIENRGRIVNKEDLLREVWKDAFVEEGNITYTIRLLRKTFNDDRRAPRFIETVPKRGYRFIAQLAEVDATNRPKTRLLEPPAEHQHTGIIWNRRFVLAGVALVLAGFLTAGTWLIPRSGKAAEFPVFQAAFRSQPLSTDGQVPYAVISQDGKEIIYIRTVGGKQEVWLRQLDSSNNVQIIPPASDSYFGLALSPDAKLLYFSRAPRGSDTQTDILRVSSLGGAPKTILKEAQGWISVSADGNKLSYVRCYHRDEDNCSLWLADSDGGGETRVLSRPSPIRIGSNSISPDGNRIAFAVGRSDNWANEFGLSEVDIKTGVEREITNEKFFNIKSVQWLPDGTGLLITARKNIDPVFRIWLISSVSGQARPVTNDGTDYSTLSIDANAEKIVSTSVKHDARLRLYSLKKHVFGPDIIDAESVSFAPSGRLYFSSRMTGNDEIWSANSDGSDKRQMTLNEADQDSDDAWPLVSRDNSFIFFTSNKTGRAEIWRIRTDGGDQTQITFGEGGFARWVSPDGAWLYYQTAMDKSLWRVPTNGGAEEQVDAGPEGVFRVSPDGQYLALIKRNADQPSLSIKSLADGREIRSFPLKGIFASPEVAWSPDSTSVIYFSIEKGESEEIAWQQRLDAALPVKIAGFGTEGVADLAISPDGALLAVAQGQWNNDISLITGLK